MNATQHGIKIGNAIFAHCKAEGITPKWTGLMEADVDFLPAEIVADDAAMAEVERAAKESFLRAAK